MLTAFPMMQHLPPISVSAALPGAIHAVTQGRNATGSGRVKPTLAISMQSLQGNPTKSCPGRAGRAVVLSPGVTLTTWKWERGGGKESLL